MFARVESSWQDWHYEGGKRAIKAPPVNVSFKHVHRRVRPLVSSKYLAKHRSTAWRLFLFFSYFLRLICYLFWIFPDKVSCTELMNNKLTLRNFLFVFRSRFNRCQKQVFIRSNRTAFNMFRQLQYVRLLMFSESFFLLSFVEAFRPSSHFICSTPQKTFKVSVYNNKQAFSSTLTRLRDYTHKMNIPSRSLSMPRIERLGIASSPLYELNWTVCVCGEPEMGVNRFQITKPSASLNHNYMA